VQASNLLVKSRASICEPIATICVRGVQLDPEAQVLQVLLARQYAAIGRNDEAQEILDRLETESHSQ